MEAQFLSLIRKYDSYRFYWIKDDETLTLTGEDDFGISIVFDNNMETINILPLDDSDIGITIKYSPRLNSFLVNYSVFIDNRFEIIMFESNLYNEITNFLNENTANPSLISVIAKLKELSVEWKDIPMLARTHGQPASPTRLGKEILVFVERLEEQMRLLFNIPFAAKFGGATGNFNAHHVAYPEIDWKKFGTHFVEEVLGLHHSFPTTQIEHYDHFAAFFDALKRINTILIDLDRDIWTYVSMDYFKQKIKAGEIGSSAMPHKVNPIDFENSEGNLGIANAIFEHLSAKLPISRLQRDLTDSTVLRNIGVPIGHTIIGFEATLKGLNKLLLNETKLAEDLEKNWAVVAEAIQTILRREGYPNPYEALKELTRTNTVIDKTAIHNFIQTLNVSNGIKNELLKITPSNYLGI